MTQRLTFKKSQEFTARISKLIPGGAHTYSKGADQFPEESPSGIQRGKGARVWDADGNCLVDWGMALAATSLGYAHDEIDAAVCRAIADGINFSRPAQIELAAAETFLSIVGTEMVKFARHGSAVTTSAVKLARAFTGRAKVAVAREHPFFSYDDWFIGTTPADHGIPDALKQFSLRFSYNDIDSLTELFRCNPNEIACVILEPVKFDPPKDDFLHKVRDLCTRNGAVLILDEMITGLKMGVPGASKFFGVEADLYTFGKGIANGYAAAALTGRAEIMELGGISRPGDRKLFLLSTTHGAEAVGLAAMMKTLQLFADGRLIKGNWATGEELRRRMNEVIQAEGLQDYLKLTGYPCNMALQTLGKDGQNDWALRTLLIQEMAAHGVLFQGIFILTPSHGPAEVDETVQAFRAAAPLYRQALECGTTDGLLSGHVIKPVFRSHV